MPEAVFVSRYERRVAFVREVLQQNSALDDEAAQALAVQVVHAVDHIPEPNR